MRVHVIDHNSTHRHLLARMIVGAVPNLDALTFSKTHSPHEEFSKAADLIVVSGGTWLVNKNPGTHRRLLDSIFSLRKPVFGICLGAESIANYFGAELQHLTDRVEGIQPIELIDTQVAQSLGKRTLDVYEYHRWSIQSTSSQILTLASSETGVEFFRHKTLPIWGSQFHPEVRRGRNEGHLLFSLVLDEILSHK